MNPLEAQLPTAQPAPTWEPIATGTLGAGGLTGLLAGGAIALSWGVPFNGDVAVLGLVAVFVAASLGAGLGVGVRRLGRARAQAMGILGAWLVLPLTLAVLWADGLPTDSLWLLLAGTLLVAPILALLGLFVGESAWRAAHPEVARLGLREGLRTAPGVSVWPAVVATSSVGTGLAGLVVAGATLLYASRVDIVTVAALGVGSAVVTASLGWVATRRAVDSAPTLRGRVDAGIPLWVAGLTAAFAIAPLAGGLVQLLTRPPFDVDLGPYPSLAIGLLADLVLAPVLVIAGAGVAELGWWVARRR